MSLLSLDEGSCEAIFKLITACGFQCADCRPDHMAADVFLRVLQHPEYHPPVRGQSDISSLCAKLPLASDTLFSTAWLQQNQAAWKHHCRNIADYLTLPKGLWWDITKSGVIFHDITGDGSEPPVFFWSTTTVHESQQKVDRQWDMLSTSKSPH